MIKLPSIQSIVYSIHLNKSKIFYLVAASLLLWFISQCFLYSTLFHQKCRPIFPNYTGPLDHSLFADVNKLELFDLNGVSSPNEANSVKIDDLYQQRSEQIKENCKITGTKFKSRIKSEPDYLSRFVFYPNLNVLYCSIAKCGNTAWSNILLELEEGKVPELEEEMGGGIAHNPYKLRGERKLALHIFKNFASSATRVVVVRHPISRLFSGFKYIQFEEKIYWLKNFSDLNRDESSKYGFPIIESYVTNLLLTHDRHFQTYEKGCVPCEINYNAIVKIDDFSEADKFFLDSNHFDSHTKRLYRRSNTTIQNRSVRKSKVTWKHYFSGLRPQTWIKLLERYRKDFEHFGYNLYYCSS